MYIEDVNEKQLCHVFGEENLLQFIPQARLRVGE